MDLKKLEYLLKIVETNSITEAARQLYITQPALSQVLTSLEKKYDIKIFERKEGGLCLTYEGRLLVEASRRQVLIEAALCQELSDVKNEQSGILKIGISGNRSVQFLPVILPEWRKQFPKVQLEINTHSHMGFEKLTAEGKLDLSFVMDAAEVSPKVHRVLTYTPLFQYNCLLAVPPNHPLAEKTEGIHDWRLRPPIDLNLVREDPFITTPQKQRSNRWLSSVYDAYGFEPKSVVVINGSSLYNLVQAGVGCALLQDTVAFAQSKGAFFRLDKGDFATTLCMIQRTDAYETRAMKAFKELVRKFTAEGRWTQIREDR